MEERERYDLQQRPNFIVQTERERALSIDEEEQREDIIIYSRAGKTRCSITALHTHTVAADEGVCVSFLSLCC